MAMASFSALEGKYNATYSVEKNGLQNIAKQDLGKAGQTR